MDERKKLAIAGLFALAVMAVVLVGNAAGVVEDIRERHESAEEWCEDERDGELYNVQSIAHGGLHCELPNGTTVHMRNVEAVQ